MAFSFQCGRYALFEGAPLPCFLWDFSWKNAPQHIQGGGLQALSFTVKFLEGGWEFFLPFFTSLCGLHADTGELQISLPTAENAWWLVLPAAQKGAPLVMEAHEVVEEVQRSSPVLHPHSLACGCPKKPGQRRLNLCCGVYISSEAMQNLQYAPDQRQLLHICPSLLFPAPGPRVEVLVKSLRLPLRAINSLPPEQKAAVCISLYCSSASAKFWVFFPSSRPKGNVPLWERLRQVPFFCRKTKGVPSH
nr:uncharacterized protein LOC119716900 [Anas platyrhynchos]XP_038034798.1 uncharacterized protein LOC119716900 [Anas platyrhynchos]